MLSHFSRHRAVYFAENSFYNMPWMIRCQAATEETRNFQSRHVTCMCQHFYRSAAAKLSDLIHYIKVSLAKEFAACCVPIGPRSSWVSGWVLSSFLEIPPLHSTMLFGRTASIVSLLNFPIKSSANTAAWTPFRGVSSNCCPSCSRKCIGRSKILFHFTQR